MHFVNINCSFLVVVNLEALLTCTNAHTDKSSLYFNGLAIQVKLLLYK